jgi:uncharacterized membrane protein
VISGAPDPDEIARLRTEIAELSARVARLENNRPVTEVPQRDARFGLTAINRIGAVTVAIGVIFFFKYAVDENLIGAGLGVLLGIAFGGLLIGAGDWLARRGQNIFAQGISGCGLAALYISVYASFAFYNLISRGAGFFALVVVCVGAMSLSVRFASSAIAGLGIAGALLTPLLLHSKASVTWLDCVYMLIVAGTALLMASRRDWPVLVIVSVLLSLLAALAFFEKSAWMFVAFAGALGIMHAAVALSPASEAAVRRNAYVMSHVALLSAGLRAVSREMTNYNAAYETMSILLACWGIAALAWGLARKSKTSVQVGLVLLGIVILKLYVWDVWSLDRIYRITAFLALGGLLLFASWIYSERRTS